jgi:hypothetical protein
MVTSRPLFNLYIDEGMHWKRMWWQKSCYCRHKRTRWSHALPWHSVPALLHTITIGLKAEFREMDWRLRAERWTGGWEQGNGLEAESREMGWRLRTERWTGGWEQGNGLEAEIREMNWRLRAGKWAGYLNQLTNYSLTDRIQFTQCQSIHQPQKLLWFSRFWPQWCSQCKSITP